jgi:hypothetical protein
MAFEERLVDLAAMEPGNAEGALEGLQLERQGTEGGVRVTQSNVPEKFQNKSLDEIIQSYKELETLYGRQGQELGELRRVADDYIKEKMSAPTNVGQTDIRQSFKEPIDFDSLPESEKINAVLEEKLAPMKQAYAELQKEKFLTKLHQTHPDFLDVAKTQDFKDWVLGSELRKEMFVRADRGYDYNSAHELLSTYKAIKGIRTETKREQQEIVDSSFRNAQVETGIVEDNAPRKIYRRADIIALKMKNPARYSQLEPEIRKAYEEGRVR